MKAMLTLTEMQDRVKEFIYRPGWTLEVTDGAFEGAHFHVHAIEPDTTEKGRTIELDIHSPIPRMLSIDQFDLWVQDRLIRIECHESREWLRLKKTGKALFYPHIEGADRDVYNLKAFKEYREEHY